MGRAGDLRFVVVSFCKEHNISADDTIEFVKEVYEAANIDPDFFDIESGVKRDFDAMSDERRN